MIRELFLLMSIVIGIVCYGLVAKWYVMPVLRKLPRDKALTPLVLFHGFRYVGLAFLIPGVTAEVLDPRFAVPAAWGDLLAAVLALIAVSALRLKWALAIPLVWIFNVEGTLDLLNAVFQGVRHTPNGHMGATYFIPAVAVPALLVTHAMIFSLLLRKDSSKEV